MIYLELFLAFLKIGSFSFGGGYGMISLVRETVLQHGWMQEEELLNFIAVAESTPGPMAVNMATFVGASQGGIGGSLAATAGVVLPSFVIILCIAACVSNFLKYRMVKGFLAGVRPAVVAMILATAGTLALTVLFSFRSLGDPVHIEGKAVLLAGILCLIHCGSVKKTGKKPSPIGMILISAVLGILLWY